MGNFMRTYLPFALITPGLVRIAASLSAVRNSRAYPASNATKLDAVTARRRDEPTRSHSVARPDVPWRRRACNQMPLQMPACSTVRRWLGTDQAGGGSN